MLGGCRLFSSYELSDPSDDAQAVRGTVSDFLTGAPLPGVEVCVFDTELCTFTDADGRYDIDGLIVGDEGMFEFVLDGYQPALHHGTVPSSEFVADYELITVAAMVLLLAPVDPPVDVSSPMLLAQMSAPGGDVTLAPDVGFGPFYMDEEGTLATEGPFLAMAGWHGMADGVYTFTASHPTLTCERDGGWAADTLDQFRMEAVSGYISTAPPFNCR